MDGEDIAQLGMLGILGFLFFIMISFLAIGVPLMIYDSMYVVPIASEKANQHCQEQGFDFYEKYSRIGILSKEPIAVICKYVEQYRDIDLNINREKN